MVTYCTSANIFQGTWSYSSNGTSTIANTTFPSRAQTKIALFQTLCPKTLSYYPLREREGSCGYYRDATFLRQSECQVMTLQESYKAFINQYEEEMSAISMTSSTTRKLCPISTPKAPSQSECILSAQQPFITFVGDSMSYQLYATTTCLAEYYLQSLKYLPIVTHLRHQFLRNDIPCSDECVRNETFRLQSARAGKYTCSGCSATGGRKISFRERFPWFNKLSPTTKILVFNTGAWFASSIFQDDSFTWFLDTILYMRFFCEQLLIQKPHLDIYFYELTPMVPEVDHRLRASWERGSYAKKNELLHTFLGKIPGVTVLNTSHIFAQKKLDEKAAGNLITADGLHWCYPGLYAVPTFVMESILHLHVTKKMSKQNDQLLQQESAVLTTTSSRVATGRNANAKDTARVHNAITQISSGVNRYGSLKEFDIDVVFGMNVSDSTVHTVRSTSLTTGH